MDETDRYAALITARNAANESSRRCVDVHDSHSDMRMYATDNENCCPAKVIDIKNR